MTRLSPTSDRTALPVIRSMEIVNGHHPATLCPSCGNSPRAWFFDAINEDGSLVGWVNYNSCCWFTWFEPAEAMPRAGVLA